jgi:membrane-bound metal-dependent hydrolase YbcI (DUF457 family)
MSSPVGHFLGGVAAAWAVDLVPGDRAARPAPEPAPFFRRAGNRLTILCGLLAVTPDLDLFLHNHRTVTHSVTAVLVVAAVSAVLAKCIGSRSVARTAFMCAGAYGSHLLLDWLAVDISVPCGIQMFWPLSSRWYISGWSIFPGTERRHILGVAAILINATAVAWEVLLLAPVLGSLWLVRVKALAGLPAETPGGDHAAE